MEDWSIKTYYIIDKECESGYVFPMYKILDGYTVFEGLDGAGTTTQEKLLAARLASEGFLFERCMASSSWTLPSVMSIHTGLYPFTHGVEWVDRRLDEFRPTLARFFKEKGYQTGGIQSSLFLQGYVGFGRGFDHYEERPIHDHLDSSSKNLTERSLEWLKGRDPGRPFFFWVHYLDPHYDYLLQPEAGRFIEGISDELIHRPYPIMNLKEELYSLRPEEYEAINQLYHGEILHTDGYLGRLIDYLEQEGMDEETWVVVTADHGEMMGEHGMLGHTESFHQPVLHVPLIIRPPGGLAEPVRSREALVSLIDIAPTILQAVGIGFEAGQFEGLPLLDESGRELNRPGRKNSLWASTRTEKVDFVVRWEDDLKFVRDYQQEKKGMFDLQTDPAEKNNIWQEQQSRWELFQKALEEVQWLRRRTGGRNSRIGRER